MQANWFHYATTDTQVIGVLTWVGLAVTIAGFWVAIWQIRKIKKASEAANEAVSRMAKAARFQESSFKIAGALQHLTSAQAMLKKDNSDATVAHLFAGWNSLISARELSDDDLVRQQISDYVVVVWRLLDNVNMPGSPAPPTPQML